MTNLSEHEDRLPAAPTRRKQSARDDLAAQWAQCRAEIDTALATIKQPGRLLTDAEIKSIGALIKKVGKLADALQAPPKPARPKPNRLAAGAKLHELALAEIERSGGKLDYGQAFARIAATHWPLVKEWQQGISLNRVARAK